MSGQFVCRIGILKRRIKDCSVKKMAGGILDMFCSNCGAANQSGNFCSKCGASLAERPAKGAKSKSGLVSSQKTHASSQKAKDDGEDEDDVSPVKRNIIFASIVAVVLIFAVVFIAVQSSMNSSPTAVQTAKPAPVEAVQTDPDEALDKVACREYRKINYADYGPEALTLLPSDIRAAVINGVWAKEWGNLLADAMDVANAERAAFGSINAIALGNLDRADQELRNLCKNLLG